MHKQPIKSILHSLKRLPPIHLPRSAILLLGFALFATGASLAGLFVYANVADTGPEDRPVQVQTNPVPADFGPLQIDAALLLPRPLPTLPEPEAELVSTEVGPTLPEPDADSIETAASPAEATPQPPASTQGTTAPAPAPAPPAATSTGFRFVITALGINAPVIGMGLDANRVPQVPRTGYEVVWYNFGDAPGGSSNAVFSGHVTWGGGQPAVFYSLPQLQSGAIITVVAPDGSQFDYQVFSNTLVDHKNPASVNVMLPTSEPTLTVISCGGTWVPNSAQLFGGDYTGRTVVQARLISGG